MRTHLYTGTRTLLAKSWHSNESRFLNMGHSWDEYIPYTNVLWLNYIFTYLVKSYKRDASGLPGNMNTFLDATKELSRRFNVRTKVENGGFKTAQEVLEYCISKEWVTVQQVENYGCGALEFVEDHFDSSGTSTDE